jgi:B9 domain-containing protein 1
VKELSAFFIVVNGQVESGDFPHDDLYVRYGFTFGPDWTVVDGVETGLSQIARKTPGCSNSVVWNFPVDISFKSTNAHGWPRMSVSVYGVDALGRDVVRGYGSVLVPTFTGDYERFIHTFTPVPSSLWQRFISWFTGTYAEFYDSKFVAQGRNREVTRVESKGIIKVKFSVLSRGMGALGYLPASRPTA